MPKSLLDGAPEVFVSTTEMSIAVSRALRQGRLRKLGSRLYTKNLIDPPEQILRRHLWPLVASYVPGALIADRTALENAPAPDGSIFVVSDRKREIRLPGITIRPRKGIAPLETDRPFIDGLFLSSTARAFLENMAPSRRRRGAIARTLSRSELETRLDDMLRRGGADALNRLRDEAKKIALPLNRETEFQALDRLIGALLGTRDERLRTEQGRARRSGTPFDPDRLRLFEKLFGELRTSPPVLRSIPDRGANGRATLAFFEAYFSNFIEGTEFEVDDAADIVFRGVIPRDRPEDAHDVLGTWRIVSDPVEMSRTPSDAGALFDLLRSRHTTVMAGRPDKQPGSFKSQENRAGNTVFVAPQLVQGTMRQGFEFYRGLETPFARAVYMMFLVSEVHPFADGNGRVARVMMNAELTSAGEERILIPTVYRSNYLTALKAFSQTQTPAPLVRTLDFAQRWTISVPWGELRQTQATLARCNAFVNSAEADETGIRLRMPDTDLGFPAPLL